MTDPYNNQHEYQTPQGRSLNNTVVDKNDYPNATDYARLYKDGLALFRDAGFYFVRSVSGTHCGHKVYRRCSPKPVRGIEYPVWFKYLRLVESVEDETVMSNAMLKGTDASIELQQFWSPVTQPMSGVKASPLQGYVERLVMIDGSHRAQNESEPHKLGIQYDNFTQQVAKQYDSPRAYVPPREWFDPKLHSISFRDVFTLWAEAELEMLMLVIGRAMAGRAGSAPIGTDKVLEHTYRSVAIIIGEDAGLGKSTIFEMLFKALNVVGYQRANFRDISERFGIGAVVEADIAYKDDVTGSTLKSLIKSENTKIIASGGMLNVEDKFAKSASVECRPVLMANTNVWDPRLCYDLDPGIVDRVKLIATYRRNELQSAGAAQCSPTANDSPNFAPFVHIAWLADKLQVDREALLLWACRLAVDEFTKYTYWRGDVPTEALRYKVHDVSSRLTFSFNKDCTRAIASCMLFSHVFLSHLSVKRTAKMPFEWRELNEKLLSESFHDYRALASDAGLYRVRCLLKMHWEQNGRPESHPWSGIRKLNVLSLRSAQLGLDGAKAARKSFGDLVKDTFGELTLRDGFKGASDIVWVTSAWQACSGYMHEIEQLARLIEQIVSDNDGPSDQMCKANERMGALIKGLVDDGWLDNPAYTPRNVEPLLSEAKDMDLSAFEGDLRTVPWLS
jgi:hypothetical protein